MSMLEYERLLSSEGYKYICGIDEAGRGPLAGPLVVASVIMPLNNIIDGINDSKKLSAKKREQLYQCIIDVAIDFHIEEIDVQTIDKINILNATKLGMLNCVKALKKVDAVLIDAVPLQLDIKNISIIKGDMLSYSIAAASILAKVYRDRLMCKLDKVYPQYAFAKHKGYGTALHIALLKQYGACEIHRKTFIGHFVNNG